MRYRSLVVLGDTLIGLCTIHTQGRQIWACLANSASRQISSHTFSAEETASGDRLVPVVLVVVRAGITVHGGGADRNTRIFHTAEQALEHLVGLFDTLL